ncbi:MAG: hypothetical protein JXP34_00090 [Planctomycetes bacterium]|nr:hypothetical protein [Planctomycetota bacterium]
MAAKGPRRRPFRATPLVIPLVAAIALAASGPARGAYSGWVRAWIPSPEGGALVRVPVAGATVSIEGLEPVVADEGGRFTAAGGTGRREVEALLSGPGIAVRSEEGNEFRIRTAIDPGVPAVIEFPQGWAQPASAFVHAETMRRRLAGLDVDPPVTQPPLPIPIVVDRPVPCEMGYDPTTGRIFCPAPDPTCPHPVERTIVYHEVSHAFLAEIYGFLEPLDLQEGLADAAAVLAAGSPWIGRGIHGPGTLLREVETDAIHPVPGNAYDRGLALAGALWDLRTRLIHGGERDPDLALRLWYEAARPLPRSLEPDWGRSLLEADARIGGGNAAAIREVLSTHGLLDPPVGAPVARDLRARVEGRSVHLAWEGDPGRSGRIRVERDGAPIAILEGGERAFSDPAVPAGSHTYLVGDAEGGADPPAAVWVGVRTFRRGDANDDGAIDAGDGIRILGALFRGDSVACADAADVDDDGRLRINDPVALLLAIYGEAAPPPPPFAAWGDDPTDDGLDCGPP